MRKLIQKYLPTCLKENTRIIRYFVELMIGKYYRTFDKPVKIYNSFYFFPKEISEIDLGRYFFGHYEIQEKLLINKYLKENDMILELGGNVGVISNLINRILKIKTNHIVFEPNPALIKYLRENKDLNDSKYVVVNGVISKQKNIEFYISENILSSSSKIVTNKKINPKSYLINEIEKKYDIKFNTLVMDIEGAEIDLIIDFDLSNFKKLIIEFHPGKTKQEEINFCKTKLKNQGFVLVEKMKDVEFWKKN